MVAGVTSFILIAFAHTSKASEHEAATAAASEGLEFWLRAIPKQDLAHYGFSSEEELERAVLGKPFRVHMIHPEQILDYNDQDLPSVIVPMNNDTWLFPVVVDKRYRTLLTVTEINGVFRATGIGSSGLAEQLDAVREEWPRLKADNAKLVRVFQALSDFVVLEDEGEKGKLVPLESAAVTLNETGEAYQRGKKLKQTLYKPQDFKTLVQKLKPVVEENPRR